MGSRNAGLSIFTATVIAALALASSATYAQAAGGTDQDVTRRSGNEAECAIAANPSYSLQLFAVCNNSGSPGLAAALSVNGGVSWTPPDSNGTIADGDEGQGPPARWDPSVAWDRFGNIFVAYVSRDYSIVAILSTDGGKTYTELASFPGSVDQPTIVAASTSAAGAPVAVWLVWNESSHMVASGAAVTGLGVVGPFSTPETIPGTDGCSYGDVAITPGGAVVQACQHPETGEEGGTIVINTDADGLGPGTFGPAVAATTTNVGGSDHIAAQSVRGIDAEAGLAFDTNPTSPHFGRLYLVYTDETVDESDDTDIMLRFSDTLGARWSAPIRVNDDLASTGRSQFLPRIATSARSGNIAICWYDARNSGDNTSVQVFCTTATPAGASPVFSTNVVISDGASTSNGSPIEYGDYAGLIYIEGIVHPIWADASNSTHDNPDETDAFDALTDRVSDESIANAGAAQTPTASSVQQRAEDPQQRRRSAPSHPRSTPTPR